MAGERAPGPEPLDAEETPVTKPAPPVDPEAHHALRARSEGEGASHMHESQATGAPEVGGPEGEAPGSNAPAREGDASARGVVSSSVPYAKGVAAAVLVDAAFTVPWTLFHKHIHPTNVATAVGIMLLSANVLVGYAGGRVGGRAGLAHDDARSHWLMAWLVTLCSQLVELAVLRLHPPSAPAAAPSGNALAGLVLLAGVVFLVRFGFAMGTWAQALRDGRVSPDDERAP